jgi:hypothetical protein
VTQAFVHALADVQSTAIGAATRIWQFVVVLPSARIGQDCSICSDGQMFLDVPLLRTIAPWLPAYLGLTKPAVAQALAPQLPRELLHKPKTGFAIPVRDWLMGNLREAQERGFPSRARHLHRRNVRQFSAGANCR